MPARNKRNVHKPEFKATVAFEACKGDRTLNQIASEHHLAPVQVSQWKKRLREGASELFGRKPNKVVDPETLTAPLYQEIGRLKMEVDWLKKKSGA